MKSDILKDILIKRGRVSIKLSIIANDLAARGRRHDNSYTDTIEMDLLEKIKESTNEVDKKRNENLLNGIHSNVNDYLPAFHGNIISRMNMLQLLEFVAHRVTEYDAIVLNNNASADIDDYIDYVLGGLAVSDDLVGVISETVAYMVDRNESIRKSLPKSKETSYYANRNVRGLSDGENKEK